MKPIFVKIASGAKKLLKKKPFWVVVALIIAFVFIRKMVKKISRNIKEKQFDNEEHKDFNMLVQQYRAAMNPSGYEWMISWDGTDEDAIKRLGYQTKGYLKEISELYRQKFGEALTDALRRELEADEFQEWYNIVT